MRMGLWTREGQNEVAKARGKVIEKATALLSTWLEEYFKLNFSRV